MTNLGDAFRRMLTGSGEAATDFRSQLVELRDRAGSVTAAAKAAGVDRRTWQRWQSGAIARPKSATQEKIARATRAARVERVPTDAELRVRTRDRDGRNRTLTGDKLRLAPGTMSRARQAYVDTGSGDAAASAFLNGVGDRFYKGYLTPPEGLEGGDTAVLDEDYLPEAVSVGS